MKIKTFTAKTFAEALAQVKQELSEHAVILSTEERTGLRPRVSVTAAIDYEAGGGEPRTADGGPASQYTAPARQQEAPARQEAPTEPDDQLKREVRELRALIEGMRTSGFELALPAKKRAVMRYLRERNVREEYALRLCDTVSAVENLPLRLAQDIAVKGPSAARAVMLIGPTGVGKTTTAAKLAAHAAARGRKAAFINLDTYRIGAVEQIRIYARILGIPLAVASNPAEFRASLLKLCETRDLVIVDTVGRNPRDRAAIAETAELMKPGVPMETHLLMAANADDACMIEAYRSYGGLPVDCLAFTKVDEAVRFGSLYNLLVTYRKPVAYLTTGQRVPADIEFPTAARLAGLIAGKEHSA